jgi:hypothetical protein
MNTNPQPVNLKPSGQSLTEVDAILNNLYKVSDEDLERVGSPLSAMPHTTFSMRQLTCRC